jgi:capsule polysaccharide export protein KpsE/RkpR
LEEIKDKFGKKALNLVDYILVLLKWKKFILWFTITVTIISIILFFFVFDLIYYSTATIKSSGKSTSFLGGLEGLTDIGSIGDIVGGSSSSKELAYYQEVINSRRCLEPLIKKFNLMERDGIEPMEEAIRFFRKNKLSLEIDKPSGLLIIGVYDKNPILAKDMVEFLINELNNINIELSVLNAKNNRDFIEKRYYQAKEELKNSEDSLKAFQMVYGVAPDLQIKAAAQTVFTLESEVKAEEVKLGILKNILSSEQPEVKIQEAKVNTLKSKIQEIRSSTDVNEFLSLGNSPIIAMSYLRLQREVEIQTKILTFMLPIYEQAKIEEKRETPTILVLDKPYIAEKKSKPKRLTMVILSMFFSFFILSIGVILYEFNLKDIITAVKTNK